MAIKRADVEARTRLKLLKALHLATLTEVELAQRGGVRTCASAEQLAEMVSLGWITKNKGALTPKGLAVLRAEKLLVEDERDS